MEFPSSAKRDQLLLLFIFILAMVPQLYKLTMPVWDLTNGFIPDDAFYYYKTAHNIRNGLGPTFDSYNITNGFHPLWMLICVLTAFLTTDVYSYVRLILLVNLFFLFLLSIQVFRMFRKRLTMFFCAVLIFLINWPYRTSFIYSSGLETPLFLWLLFLTIDMTVTISYDSTKQVLLLGVLLTLTFLARTSFVFFAPILAAYLVYKRMTVGRIQLVRVILLISVPFLLLGVPYLISNYMLTGHFQQISGLVKNLHAYSELGSFGDVLKTLLCFAKVFDAGMGFWFKPLPNEVLVALNAAFLLAIIVLACTNKEPFPLVVRDHQFIMISGLAVSELIYYFVMYGSTVRDWNISLAVIVTEILFVFILKGAYDRWSAMPRARRGAKVCIAMLLLSYFVQVPYYSYFLKADYYHKRGRTWLMPDVVKWLRDNVPDDAKIGAAHCGWLGYFSQRNVINLDGLINGKEFLDYLREGKGGVLQYIVDKRIQYVAHVSGVEEVETRYGLTCEKINTAGWHYIYRIYYDDSLPAGR